MGDETNVFGQVIEGLGSLIDTLEEAVAKGAAVAANLPREIIEFGEDLQARLNQQQPGFTGGSSVGVSLSNPIVIGGLIVLVAWLASKK